MTGARRAPLPVVFDTDGGVDDCTALWWGLTSGLVDVVAVTTVIGNVDVDQATRNAAKVLDAAGRRDIPIAVGAAEPLGPAPIEPSARHVHGDDGLGGAGPPDVDLVATEEPAHEMIVRLCRERPGEITIVAVGPLSNVTLALRDEPALVDDVRDLVVMGGVVNRPGNVHPVGEFNIACDPVAAAETVAARWPSPPLLVPLDVTHVATMGHSELALLAERRTPAAAFLADPVEHYHGNLTHQTDDGGCPAHDMLALAATAEPDLLTTTTLPLRVDTGGSAWGSTVVDARPHADPSFGALWRVALEADVDAFRVHVRRLFGA